MAAALAVANPLAARPSPRHNRHLARQSTTHGGHLSPPRLLIVSVRLDSDVPARATTPKSRTSSVGTRHHFARRTPRLRRRQTRVAVSVAGDQRPDARQIL